jgi:hypothetical protein
MDLVWLASKVPFFSFFAMNYVRYTAPYGLWKTLDSSGHVSYRLKPDVAAATDSMQVFNYSVEVGLSRADTKPAITRRQHCHRQTNPKHNDVSLLPGTATSGVYTQRDRTFSNTRGNVSFTRDGFRYNNFSKIIARKRDDAYMYGPDPGPALRKNPHHHHHHLRISRIQERFMIWRALDTCP